ncbi:MAG: HNH endonuclease [Candidatus Woesearchaeota archaeon]
MKKLFNDYREMLELFPETRKRVIEEEIYDLVLNRLISTFIPNELPYKSDPLKLQNYFINEIFKRTNEKFSRRHKLINYLTILAENYHINNRNVNEYIEKKRCYVCKVNFEKGHVGLDITKKIDILNPGTYFKNASLRNEREIDHINPISKCGNNEAKNLDLICPICNSGKSDIFTNLDKFNTYNEKVELDKLSEFKKKERKKENHNVNVISNMLFYRVLKRDGNCKFCDNVDNYSLTLKPIKKDFLWTYDNLVTICYNCLKEKDNIWDIRWIKY